MRPSTLSSMAKESIRVRIVTGEIAAGEIYSAPALAAVLGVSATPVREAMLELTADGLVEVVPNRGFRVVEPSQHDLDEIFEIRLMLEVPAAERAARRGISAAEICRQDAAAVAALSTHHLEHTRGIWAGIAESAGQ